MTFPNENPKFVGFVVYKQGDNGTLFYIIFTGSVKVFQVCFVLFFEKQMCKPTFRSFALDFTIVEANKSNENFNA
jgi:hypothetical protein